MSKKKNPIKVVTPNLVNAYSSWENEEQKASALQNYGTGLTTDGHSIARTRDFSNLLPNISSRPGLTREDYEYYRPESITPTKPREILCKAELAYQRVGLIRNIIDLMGDFSSQGLRITHPNRGREQVFNDWYNRVEGNRVSERLCNLLFRHGIVYILFYTAKITDEALIKLIASPDQRGLPPGIKLEKKEIPYKYIFLDPTMVEPIAGHLSAFVNKPRYGIRLSEDMRRMINNPKSEEEKEIVKNLPAYIKEAAEANKLIPLPEDRLFVFHYKKDDWQSQANPMIYSILDDIAMLERLKLADICALDGAVSKIRIFKLGSLEHKIAPNGAAFSALAEMLENNVGGGTIDIIWGPDIELIESASDSFNFLGEEKYKSTLNSIYSAMGVPPTLTATFGVGGTTNNFISLKTLTERLEYGRSILTSFWRKQLDLVQKSLGIKQPAEIEYDRPILANEDTEKTLLQNLADRNIISEELLRRRLGTSNKMENVRLRREQHERENKKRVEKAGPYHNPQVNEDLKKVALQSGQATPSEVGLELEPNKNGEKKMMLLKPPTPPGGKPATKKKGQPGQGRPKMKKDSKKRKTKTVRPRTRGTVEFWAKEAQQSIANILNPIFLQFYDKKNMRSLTDEQAKEVESIKFGVLCNIEPFSDITEEGVIAGIRQPIPGEAVFALHEALVDFSEFMKRLPTIEEVRAMQCSVFTDINIGVDEDEDL